MYRTMLTSKPRTETCASQKRSPDDVGTSPAEDGAGFLKQVAFTASSSLPEATPYRRVTWERPEPWGADEWKHPLQSLAAYQEAIGRWSRSARVNRDEIEVALAGLDTAMLRLRKLLVDQCSH